MVKKHYNPFKMWGSYVGIGLFWYLWNLFWTFVMCDSCDNLSEKIINPFIGISHIFDFSMGGYLGQLFMYLIVPIIVGFLLGWGIHSLVRKLR